MCLPVTVTPYSFLEVFIMDQKGGYLFEEGCRCSSDTCVTKLPKHSVARKLYNIQEELEGLKQQEEKLTQELHTCRQRQLKLEEDIAQLSTSSSH